MIDYVQHTTTLTKIDSRQSRGIRTRLFGNDMDRTVVTLPICFLCFNLLSVYRAGHTTCFGGGYIPRVSFRFKHQLPVFKLQYHCKPTDSVFSERERMSSAVRLSVVCLSGTFVRPTQAIEIFGNVSTTFGTLAIC